MKLSYHAEVLGTYFRGWYSAAPADLLVIVGPSSMASILGTRIPGHFIMPLANQGNYIWDMDGYGWIWMDMVEFLVEITKMTMKNWDQRVVKTCQIPGESPMGSTWIF